MSINDACTPRRDSAAATKWRKEALELLHYGDPQHPHYDEWRRDHALSFWALFPEPLKRWLQHIPTTKNDKSMALRIVVELRDYANDNMEAIANSPRPVIFDFWSGLLVAAICVPPIKVGDQLRSELARIVKESSE